MAKTAAASTAASSRPTRTRRSPAEQETANVSKKRNPPKPNKATKKNTTTTTKTKAIAKAATIPKKAPAKSATKKPAATKKTTTTKKAAPKTATAIKKEKTTANTSRKRKAEDNDDLNTKPAKKRATASVKKERVIKAPVSRKPAKEIKKGPVLREPPTTIIEVLSFGEGTAGELGLGTAANAIDVSRPRYNNALAGASVGIVQLSAGGMHCAALTHDNRVLTWGINDNGALGRDTEWDGGLVDVKDNDNDAQKEDDADSDDDNGLNPKECKPAAMDFSSSNLLADTRFVQVVAGDTCTLAVTDDGRVYGAGAFRANDGTCQFTATVEVARRPMLIEGLKNIVQVACGCTHALALDNKGKVFAWGYGEQNQLGRRVVERTKNGSLTPREVGMPRGAKNKIKQIFSGPYHSFAITESGDLLSWGLNAYGQTGADPEGAGDDSSFTINAAKVKGLDGKKITDIAGGSFHTIAATTDGQCLVWGRVDGGQTGLSQADLEALGDGVKRNDRGKLALLTAPTPIPLEGHFISVSAGPEHSLIVDQEGKVWSTGFGANYQTGLGKADDVFDWNQVDSRAVRDRKVDNVFAGAQYGHLTAIYQAPQ